MTQSKRVGSAMDTSQPRETAGIGGSVHTALREHDFRCGRFCLDV